MEEGEIGLARMSDEPAIRAFLDQHWRAQHVFVTNPELLRWQHLCPGAEREHLTFMIARGRDDSGRETILGLLGFIPFRRFDPTANWSEVALAIWKSRDDIGARGLGVMLHNQLIQQFNPELICAIGISEMVRPIYKALGYTLDQLSHVALFPQSVSTPLRVAKGVPTAAFAEVPEESDVVLRRWDEDWVFDEHRRRIADELGAAGAPRKSGNYLQARFVDHPNYDYEIRAVMIGPVARALVVWRRVETPLGSILRIVDVVGDADVLGRCGAVLRSEVVAAGCEYVDLMHYGISRDALTSAAFVGVEDYPEFVLPNYFSPFAHRNVTINLAFKCRANITGRKVRFFRADSDQDRPNDPASATPRPRLSA